VARQGLQPFPGVELGQGLGPQVLGLEALAMGLGDPGWNGVQHQAQTFGHRHGLFGGILLTNRAEISCR